jgi:hypothetical protein
VAQLEALDLVNGELTVGEEGGGYLYPPKNLTVACPGSPAIAGDKSG